MRLHSGRNIGWEEVGGRERGREAQQPSGVTGVLDL